MKLRKKWSEQRQQRIGRLSDGSDHVVTTVTVWHAEVEDEGRFFSLTFDHDPTDDDLDAAVPESQDVLPARPAARAVRVLELNALYHAAMSSSTDTQFTAAERARLATLATGLRNRIKALL